MEAEQGPGLLTLSSLCAPRSEALVPALGQGEGGGNLQYHGVFKETEEKGCRGTSRGEGDEMKLERSRCAFSPAPTVAGRGGRRFQWPGGHAGVLGDCAPSHWPYPIQAAPPLQPIVAMREWGPSATRSSPFFLQARNPMF